MASLLAGLAAAEKIQTGEPASQAPSVGPAEAASSKSRRPSKSSKKGHKAAAAAAASEAPGSGLPAIVEGGTLSSAHYGSQDAAGAGLSAQGRSSVSASGITLDALGLSIADTSAAQAQAQPRGSTFGSQLTLDALGLSLADTGAAMEADAGVGALTMQSLGLAKDDDEDNLVDAPEDVAERMSRILEAFGPSVGATADFVLVSEGMEPDVSYMEPMKMQDYGSETPREIVTDSDPRQGAVANWAEAGAGRDAALLASGTSLTQVTGGPPEPAMTIEASAAPRAHQDGVFDYERRVEVPRPPTAAGAAPRTADSFTAQRAQEDNSVSLADLGLEMGDLTVGTDGVDDDVLTLAQQLAEHNDSPRR
jgi:hypothetical protein